MTILEVAIRFAVTTRLPRFLKYQARDFCCLDVPGRLYFTYFHFFACLHIELWVKATESPNFQRVKVAQPVLDRKRGLLILSYVNVTIAIPTQ